MIEHLFIVFTCIRLCFCFAGTCDDYLLSGAELSASSYLRNREPGKARLDGGTAWTAASSDFAQYISIDLGETMMVTGVATQGRPHSSEYVMEYSVSYGMSGYDFVDYKYVDGSPKLFKGNKDAENVRTNYFSIPIIAKWVRINPTRWRDRISMRVELIGCSYYADTMFFNGSSIAWRNISRYPVRARSETVRFRMRTNHPNGVILYSRGTQGDYLSMQIKENKLVVAIDLGAREKTLITAGSLLDDNLWHDVTYRRDRRDLTLSVDRVEVREQVLGDFSRLDLNREFFVGGVPFIQEGLEVVNNFTGCLENLLLNRTNFIEKVRERTSRYRQENTLYYCPDQPLVPVTFLSKSSYVRFIGYENVLQMNVSFEFRTYEEKGMLMYHRVVPSGHVKLYLDGGKIKVELVTQDMPVVIIDNYNVKFNDGRWHFVMLTMRKDLMVLSVDRKPMQTRRKIKFSTGTHYFVAGGEGTGDTPGFMGCMRRISIDGNEKHPLNWGPDEFDRDDVVIDACQMVDRCSPNPCEHGGTCYQNMQEFFCNCLDTGYGGAVCHTTVHHLSCESYRQTNPNSKSTNIYIDVDGSGDLAPFPVQCEFFNDGTTVTSLGHQSEQETLVDAFDEPGSYSKDMVYNTGWEQIEKLVNRSDSCRQEISYKCFNAKLFNTPVLDQEEFRPFTWWVSRHNQQMDYWGGSFPGTYKCQCGIYGSCVDPNRWCNCDAEFDMWQEDKGELSQKEDLPVRQIRVGNTGDHVDSRKSRYSLGKLKCYGDSLYRNTVTFRVPDASIDLPTFKMGQSGDMYFEFKTTQENGVLFHSQGSSDYIKVAIVGGNQLQLSYQAGANPLGVTVETSGWFNDDEWHSVSVERNLKQARMVVDGAMKSEVREPAGPTRGLELTSKLVIGATYPDYRDGYVGCFRALMLNGILVDLEGIVQNGVYGVSLGCTGKCASNPCLNNGTCLEGYDHYDCNCEFTSFKGPICADEIGVNMRSHYMIKYQFEGSYKSTLAERLRVGFTTVDPRGFLVALVSNITGEYMTLMVSNSGHLRLVFDFGFERQEIVFKEQIFNKGQFHDVLVTRINDGRTMIMKVDNYKPLIYEFTFTPNQDAQFNNIQYLYVGKNESMKEGFVGCIARVEFDDIFPLNLLFQEDPEKNIRSSPPTIRQDFCGIEPVTHPPEVAETRPPPDVDEEVIRRLTETADSAVLGVVIAVILVALLVMIGFILCYMSRHKGEYLTQEDKGAKDARNADFAVIKSPTGHKVEGKKEWFI